MASADQVPLNDPHTPHENALRAFEHVIHDIKLAIRRSRNDWDKHEPRMWERAAGLSDDQLTDFSVRDDLVLVRSGPTAYGTIIFGKFRIPAIQDKLGEGFVHVRIHDPPDRGTEDVKFHSLFTDEGHKTADGHPTTWQAVQTWETLLGFFDE